MAFRNKAHLILKHQPDILVIPECECIDKLKYAKKVTSPTSSLWFGDNQHKGIGIFSYNGYTITPIDNHNTSIRFIIPLLIKKGREKFTLFAIWAWNPDDPDGKYVEQIWKAIHYYDKLLTNKRTMLVGDFNSNTFWDRKYRVGNHSHVVEKLAGKGIHSVYHHHYQQTQGKEEHPTWYMYRHKNKPYHLDYCFASEDLVSKMQSVEIGEHRSWKKHSDHMPVIVKFDLQ